MSYMAFTINQIEKYATLGRYFNNEVSVIYYLSLIGLNFFTMDRI